MPIPPEELNSILTEFDLNNEHKTEAILSATDKGPMLKLLGRKSVVLPQPAGAVK